MFEGINNVQQFADKVKGAILDMVNLSRVRRIEGLRAVNDLERCGWHPAMMIDAIRDVMGDTDDGWLFLEGVDSDVLENIERVIRRYLAIYGCEGGDVLSDVFDMHEAAAYLGITYDGIKAHVSRLPKHLRGVMKGRTMLFTRQQLDAFKKDHIRNQQG